MAKPDPTAEDVADLAGVRVDAAKCILACSGANRDPKKAGHATEDMAMLSRASGHSEADCTHVMTAYNVLI